MATNKRERSDFSDAVAAQVRAERAAADLTQAQVYEPAGLSRSTYIRLESGTHIADTTQLAHICTALGVSIPDFFTRVANRAQAAEVDDAPAPRRPVVRRVEARSTRRQRPRV